MKPFPSSPVTFSGRMIFEFTKDGRPTGDHDKMLSLFRTLSQFNRGDDGEQGLREFEGIILSILNGTFEHQIFDSSEASEFPTLRQDMQAWMMTTLRVQNQQGRALLWNGAREYVRTSTSRYIATLSRRSRNGDAQGNDGLIPEIQAGRPYSDLAFAKREIIADCRGAMRAIKAFRALRFFPLASLFERYQAVGDRMLWNLSEQSLERVSSYLGIRALRTAQVTERKEARETWLKGNVDHERYYNVRPQFVEFELGTNVRLSRFRYRSEDYLSWLQQNPALASWRGGEARISPLDQEGEEQVKKAKGRRKLTARFRHFFRLNPEIEALDRVHGEYDRLFAIRRKGKLRDDDYADDVTYTRADPVSHPHHLRFAAQHTSPVGWRNLDVRKGLIDLKLFSGQLNESGAEGVADFQTFRFRPDKRFKRFLSRVEEDKKGVTFLYKDQLRNAQRRVRFAGLRVRFRDLKFCDDAEFQMSNIGPATFLKRKLEEGKLMSATVYLDFTVDLERLPKNPRAEKIQFKKKERRKNHQTSIIPAEELSKLNLPDGAVVACVIPNVGELAWVSVFRSEKGKPPVQLRTRHVKPIEGLREADSEALAQEFFRKARWSGGKQQGQRFCVSLQEAMNHTHHQRIRQGAFDIVVYALGAMPKVENGKFSYVPMPDPVKGAPADYLLIGTPGMLKVHAANPSPVNRQRAGFAAMSLSDLTVQIAGREGLKSSVCERTGYHNLCASCGKLGIRYGIRKKAIQFTDDGELFACSSCDRLSTSAFMNASQTLLLACITPESLEPHRQFRLLSQGEQTTWEEELQTRLKPALLKIHQLKG